MMTKEKSEGSRKWVRLYSSLVGLGALLWFLLRVIPKPSRAVYPCQRAAFPVASAFVIWICGSVAGIFSAVSLRRFVHRHRFAGYALCFVTIAVCGAWLVRSRSISAAEIATRYDFTPKLRNAPMGIARGIYPGRVTWSRDPLAAHWSGHIESATDQWWMDTSTDQTRVDAMLSSTLRNLTGTTTDEAAWRMIFTYYNGRAHGLPKQGYRAGEIVAVKVNLNSSSIKDGMNLVNVSPQVALAMVRQLVNNAHVPTGNIVIYDARRDIYSGMLTKIWSEFKMFASYRMMGPIRRSL